MATGRLEAPQSRLKPRHRRVMAKLRDEGSNATGPNQVWRWIGCTTSCSTDSDCVCSPWSIPGAACARCYVFVALLQPWRPKVPLDRRGPKPRSDECGDGASTRNHK